MADGWGGMLGMLPAKSFSVQGAALPWNEVASLLSVLTAVSYSKTTYWEYWFYSLFSMHALLRTQGLFLRIALLIQWESETSTSANLRYTYQIIMMHLASQHKYGLLDLRNVKRETVADELGQWNNLHPTPYCMMNLKTATSENQPQCSRKCSRSNYKIKAGWFASCMQYVNSFKAIFRVIWWLNV